MIPYLRYFFSGIAGLLLFVQLQAVEGMWIPSRIEQNMEQMHQMGFQLSASHLYNEDSVSFKDAIVRFGRGCTGAFISPNGLLITNHHCGYRQIQRHSTLQSDYLTQGFWANSYQEELPNEDLSVRILVRMENVTRQIWDNIESGLPEIAFQAEVAMFSRALTREASENGRYEAIIAPFYHGNEYYLFVYQVFNDVRMVGAPPSSIGKYGGDTDNWMWPRHSGDFMLFRVYANQDNEPAEYSPDNVPYQPAKHFAIANRDPQPDEFTMVYGFPGRTQRYLTSHAVDFIVNSENPMGIRLRTEILSIYDYFMGNNDQVRIQYATKHAGISNAWKRWKGENNGLIRLDAVNVKRHQEDEFLAWVAENPHVSRDFDELLSAFEDTYLNYHPFRFAFRLYFEAGRNVEVNRFALEFGRLVALSKASERDDQLIDTEIKRLKELADRFFRDYHAPIDQEIMAELTRLYIGLSDPGLIPPVIQNVKEKYDSDTQRFAKRVFDRSMLVSHEKTMNFLENYKPRHHRRLERDPAFAFARGLGEFVSREVQVPMQMYQNKLDSLYRVYLAANKIWKPDENFFPDANGTLRITYGRVEGSLPRDGLKFLPYTSSDGILQKAADLQTPDYRITERLQTLLQNRVFGRFASEDMLMVNFIASNHTTGGNSGSPVLDAYGHFIGINFDRSWESTMSDIMFDAAQCRNISVSSRYILWVIETYAGMGYLLDEMQLVP